MALVNRNRISLYQEARDGLISLFQQTAQVFIGLLLLLILTGGNPPGFLVGLSFVAGIMFVAFKENKRLKRFIATKSSELLQQEMTTFNPAHEEQGDTTYQSPTASQSNASDQTLTNLNQWLQGTVNAGWETVQALENLFGTKLAVVRSDIKRGKLITLGASTDSQAVILLVGVTRGANQTINILLQIYPSRGQTYLPQGLKLTVLQASGEPAIDAEGKFLEAEAKTNSYYIQRQVMGTPGENFSIRITLENTSVIQKFII